MPIYGMNTTDVWVTGLAFAEDDSPVTDAILHASVYDQTQFPLLDKGQAGTPMTGATDIELEYKPPTEDRPATGHYRGNFAATVGLTIGKRVRVKYFDDGTYGIEVWKEFTVQKRTG